MARKRPRLYDGSHIDIIPLGNVDSLTVSIVAANLQTILGLNSDIRPPIKEAEYAYVPARQQYAAGKILTALESLEDGPPVKLGIAPFDLCTPILKFVFGESQLGGKAAVISLSRLQDKDPERAYRRAAKIGIHETGHVLGLGHCRAPDCLMAFSSGVEKLDSLPLRFCSACEYEIARCLKQRFGRP